ncbi:hypothetical protein TrLO_g12059 [Triparma laevis f. longispina]|uniref:Uncharacterized protein n=1 Tax=Triparma laevis f. longispina TaxID=1714387 RepID=A0A9W7AQ54_9STRA|nr:hypothetical protein TrLO_g12059 [Triparma laevis f. longispina]
MIAPLNYVNTLRFFLTGKKILKPENLILLVQLGLLIHFGDGWKRPLGLFLVMHAVSTWLLMVFSTPVHRSEFGWTSGCEEEVEEEGDFGKHAVLSTDDYLVTEASLFAKLFASRPSMTT